MSRRNVHTSSVPVLEPFLEGGNVMFVDGGNSYLTMHAMRSLKGLRTKCTQMVYYFAHEEQIISRSNMFHVAASAWFNCPELAARLFTSRDNVLGAYFE